MRLISSSILIALLCGLFACSSGAAGSGAGALATIPLTIRTADSRALSLAVEVADSDAERSQGLMNRQSLDTTAGMLFVFDEEALRVFWMQNTYVSLDLLFISAAREVLFIHENAVPLSTDLIAPNVQAQYVLEVNAGYAEENGVVVGDVVEFEL